MFDLLKPRYNYSVVLIHSLLSDKNKFEIPAQQYTGSEHRLICKYNNKINNKNDSGEKIAVKKTSDHNDVDMFAKALQFHTLFKSCHIKLYSTLFLCLIL